MADLIKNEIQEIVERILTDYDNGRAVDKMDDPFGQPDKAEIIDIVTKLMQIVFPGYFRDKFYKIYNLNSKLILIIEDVMYHLNKQITLALKFRRDYKNVGEREISEEAQLISLRFFNTIPRIREYVDTDLQAAFDGDPAAYHKDEIILSYPGIFAITVYRIAHELYIREVPLIPRIMTEYAHSITGIDINPGASIGKYFFIDHGTGIVIGETTVIGDHVKIYQGVTLGALSTKDGQKLKSKKRHPTIGNYVTIYSGASILGGETVIGEGAVIGGNTFITKSIEPGTRVSIKNMELQMRTGNHEDIKELEQDDCWYYII